MKSKLKSLALLAAFAIACAIVSSGCALLPARTIYVPAGEPVQLRQSLKDVKVWVFVDGKRRASNMDIPEGWYALENYVLEDGEE